MSNRAISYSTDPEARKVVARNGELPQCEGMRVCAAFTAILQFFLTSEPSPNNLVAFSVQLGFFSIGFMAVAYLLRDRDLTKTREAPGSVGTLGSLKELVRSLPLLQIGTVVIIVLMLPRLTALEAFKLPDMADVPAIIVKFFSNYFSDFQKPGFDGRTLSLFPLVILLVPRRCLSLALLSVLGSAMILQFVGLFSYTTRQASIFVSPSAFDLLAFGSFLAIITRQSRIGRCEARIGGSAVFSGLLVGIAVIIVRLMNVTSGTITFSLFLAPTNFGMINFIVEVVGTTLVSALWWRDLGGMMEDLNRAPAY